MVSRTDLNDLGWSAPQPIIPASLDMDAGAPISVVGRRVNGTGDPLVDNDQLDVFAVERSGKIVHAHWRYGDDNYTWNPAHAEELTTAAPSGATIGALALWPGTIQVAARRNDFTMAHAWVEDVEAIGGNWQNGDVADSTGTSLCRGVCCGTGQVCLAKASCCDTGKVCGTACCGGFDTCGGGGQAGVCGCTPITQCNGACGTIDDGCGRKVQCGGCATGQTCVTNQCVANRCKPRTCPKGSYWNTDDCQCEKLV